MHTAFGTLDPFNDRYHVTIVARRALRQRVEELLEHMLDIEAEEEEDRVLLQDSCDQTG